jgi:hypothetical protein
MLGEAGIGFGIADEATVRELLTENRGDLDSAEFPDSLLLAEWRTVIDYWGIQDWADYKNVSRSGRAGRCRRPSERRSGRCSSPSFGSSPPDI